MGYLSPQEPKSQTNTELAVEVDPHTSVTLPPPSAASALVERLLRAAPGSCSAGHALPLLDANALAGVSLSELAKLINDLFGSLNELEKEQQARALAASASRGELELALARSEAEREQAETACFALQSELSRAHEALSHAEELRAEARSRADKRERERDELRAETSRLRAQLGANAERPSALPSPLPLLGRSAGCVAPAALALDDGELDSSLHVTPRLPSVAPRFGAGLPMGGARPPGSYPAAPTSPRETTGPSVGGQTLPAPSFGPPPSGWTALPPPADEPKHLAHSHSAANLPQARLDLTPPLKQKPDPATRPLIDYSLGEGGVQSEVLEGARLSSTPPRK